MIPYGTPGYDEPTTLYRYYSAEGGLLYIGITRQLWVRDTAHFQDSPWRRFSAFVRVETYPTRVLAEIAERNAIYEEDPPHNAKWPGEFPPEGLKRDWYLQKMGGLKGELVRWAATGCTWPATLTPCDAPDWWDEARVFSLPYTGGKPKWFPKPAPPEPPSEADAIVWGPR